jgi:hypothetical protein
MKIFLAGNVGVLSREITYSKLIRWRLLSFYEISLKIFASDQSFNFIIQSNGRSKRT